MKLRKKKERIKNKSSTIMKINKREIEKYKR